MMLFTFEGYREALRRVLPDWKHEGRSAADIAMLEEKLAGIEGITDTDVYDGTVKAGGDLRKAMKSLLQRHL